MAARLRHQHNSQKSTGISDAVEELLKEFVASPYICRYISYSASHKFSSSLLTFPRVDLLDLVNTQPSSNGMDDSLTSIAQLVDVEYAGATGTYSRETWEEHRAEISELYAKNTLNHVMKIMNERHKFTAS